MSEYSSYMWSVPDWRTDEMWSMLDNREKGVYRELIDECWVNGSILSDPALLARFVHESPEYFSKIWPKINKKFKSIDGGGRLICPRLERDRQRLKGIRQSRSEASAIGNAEKRRRRELTAKTKGTHTDDQWQAMLILADFTCVRCGYSTPRLQKDHIQPIYQGGSNSIDNIQPLCKRCNSQKGPECVDYRKFDWRCLNDAAQVTRICEPLEMRLRSQTEPQIQTQKESGSLLEDSPNTETSTVLKHRGERVQKTRAPAELPITDSMLRWAEENGLAHIDLRREAEAMLDHFRGKGEARQDWTATWRAWMRNTKKFNRNGNGNGQPKEHYQDRIVRENKETAERLHRFFGDTTGDGAGPEDPGGTDITLRRGPK